MSAHPASLAGPNVLIDALVTRFKLKNDAHLARLLQVAPPVISKVRRYHLRVGSTLLLNMHETFGVPVAELRALGDLPRERDGKVE